MSAASLSQGEVAAETPSGVGAPITCRPRLSFNSAPIRWKLFILISAAVALPVVILVIYFVNSESSLLNEALSGKALSLSQLLGDQLKPAIAFNDEQTARELFASASVDPDIAHLALYRADGSTLSSVGVDPDAPPVNDGSTVPRHVEDGDDYVRVRAPIATDEGPLGTLVIGYSKERLVVAVSRVNEVSWYLGCGLLALGCLAAWFVGGSLAKRIERVKRRAEQVAAGDLSDAPLSDTSSDEIGQMARAFQVMVGIVERKVTERTSELAASREQLRYLLESTDAIPWQIDVRTQQITYIGPQAASTFGATNGQLLDRALWMERVSPSEFRKVRDAMAKTLMSGEEGQAEFTFRRSDGKDISVRMLMSVSRDGERTTIMGFVFDVTNQRQMELDLRQAQKLESVGRLAAGVAHEINTPIQFVSDSVHFIGASMSDLLPVIEGYRTLHPELRRRGLDDVVDAWEAKAEEADLDYLLDNMPKCVERSLEGLKRVATIVHAMKEFAHPERLEKTSADLNAALSATLIIARNEYKFVADAITEFCDLPPVTCHIGELNQAFLNIIVNAAHAIADHNKGRAEMGSITVATLIESGDAVVRITDTGGGIPEAVQHRIFDPFFTTKEVGRGTGQGLAIARSVVVDKHAGRLTFQTEPGKGTTFEIRLPLDQRDSPATAIAA